MTIFEFVDLIKKADLSKLSYRKIKSIIVNNEIQFPYITTLIRKGQFIERGRLNENGVFYSSEFEVSYRTDLGNIREFGRANEPYRSRFYGTLMSNEIPFPRHVLFSEIDKKYNNIPDDNYESVITVGRWEVKEDFEVADVCFSEKYFESAEVKDRYDLWLDKIKGSELDEKQYLELLTFFSDEFAKSDIKSHHDYKLSSIYSDYAILANKLNGLLYPSVKVNYKGNNIVLTPEAVDKYLELVEVAMFKYEVKEKKGSLKGTHYANDLGPLNTKFTWNEIDKNVQE